MGNVPVLLGSLLFTSFEAIEQHSGGPESHVAA